MGEMNVKLDDTYLEIGNIIICPIKTVIKGKNIQNTKSIRIFSKNEECSLSFYTICPINLFNSLVLNEKKSILNMIDSYDISLSIKGDFIINSSLNSEIYFTKLSNLVFKVNVTINNHNDAIVSCKEQTFSKFELETVLDFNGCEK